LGLVFKRKRLDVAPPTENSHSDGRASNQDVLTIQECEVEISRGKSLWDPNFDIPAHGGSCFLPNKDKFKLMAHDEEHLHHETEKILIQAFALACVVNVKAKDWKRAEDQRFKQNLELHQEFECLQDEFNRLGVALANKTQEELVWAEEKGKLFNEIESLKKYMTCKEEYFSKVVDSFKEDTTQSYLVGFEAALE